MQQTVPATHDDDALHILPLSHMPLKTAGLRKARIVKNVRLDGVVELFSDQASGSGQIHPRELTKVFEFCDDNESDLDVVSRLCELPSYDVYSLRVSLREAGIAVDQHKSLKLSEEAQRELTPYMKSFTEPLVKAVYGSKTGAGKDLGDLIALFVSPDVKQARENLERIADVLAISIADLPAFLENYGDAYLSLAYYQRHMDGARPNMVSFLQSATDLKHQAKRSGGAAGFLKACERVERALDLAATQIAGILQMFRTRTKDMWRQISQIRFRAVRELIKEHQMAIGGCLCAFVVKLRTWSERFPRPEVGGASTRMNFIVSEMLPGIEKIGEIRYSDA